MISVILPYYNSQETIKHSIDSILNQTYQDFELLIINAKIAVNNKTNPLDASSLKNHLKGFDR